MFYDIELIMNKQKLFTEILGIAIQPIESTLDSIPALGPDLASGVIQLLTKSSCECPATHWSLGKNIFPQLLSDPSTNYLKYLTMYN